jgi:hypothetical protein
MFCAPGQIFGGTKGVGSRGQVLRSRTHFRRCRVRQVQSSCFARPDSFSTIPRASGLVFMFCAPTLDFGGTERVRSRFNVLRSRTHFRLYRGRRVPFSCFAGPNSFSAESRASDPVFMLCAPGHIFGCIEGVESRFHFLWFQNCIRWHRGRRVPLTSFALPDSFSAVPSASGPVFMYCAPRCSERK